MENMLAENIRRCRKSLGFTQEQLAERLGVTLGAVSKWERGGSEPDLAYIMDLAELFHVSVDALIGFTMRGLDADAEADRIGDMAEKQDLPGARRVAEEYEDALKKFPNHFRIVCDAALTHKQIGILYREDGELRRSLELFRHAIDLISQNRDPLINEVILRNEIAECHTYLKNYKKAIETYKNNNPTGSNDAQIGLLYTHYEKKPDEGLPWTRRAFFRHINGLITTMAGYMAYYIATGSCDRGIRTAEWTIRMLGSLKRDPLCRAFTDKIVSVFLLDLALLRDMKGDTEAAEETLREAVNTARDFDADPVFTLENLIFYEEDTVTSVYDDTGPTALDGLRSSLKSLDPFVSDAFREMFARLIAEA